MSIWDKPIREWNEADVMELVRFGRAEGPTLEYKAALYETADRGNREFLLDICSMANASGGALILGIAEQRSQGGQTGLPDPHAPLGLECANPEQILASYEGRILDCIDERLLVESHVITLESGRRILAFRVPNSLRKPHRVFYQGRTYFPARRERQRYDLNAAEVKDMVLRTATRLESAEALINEALLRENEAHDYLVITIAIVPVFTRNFAVDFRRQQVIDAFARFDITGQGRTGPIPPSFSIEGLTRSGQARGTKVTLEHNGLIRLSVRAPGITRDGVGYFNPGTADLYVRGVVRGCRALFETADLSPPALLGVRLINSNECHTSYEHIFEDHLSVPPFTKTFPSLILETLDFDVDSQIRPMCEFIHQSFGERHSPAFDDEGVWVLPPPR